MATTRSSFPSRLRQLLSGESVIGPSIKLDTEPPAKIKAFIDKVIQSPLQDIAIPLSGFHWEYSKGKFHHWRPLFLHFDTYFKTYLSSRNDLLLTHNVSENDSPFPKQAVLQILRAMQIILENCHNKSSFDGIEHFKLLLSSTDPEVLIATLETLSALVKINPSKLHGTGKLIGCGSLNSYLLSLAQGWGSKEEGLGLYSCVMANERSQEEGLCLFPSEVENDHDKSQYRIGSTLYFELHGFSAEKMRDSSGNANSSGLRVIHIPDLHLRKEDDQQLMKQCIEQYNVPPDLQFSLLTRIRYARAFRSPRVCRMYSRICLLAFIVLVQSSDANDELTSFFANEPEYTNELIRIVRSEETVPGTIRTLAMLALGAQLAAYSASHERARILSGSSISFAVGNRMILLNVLQRAVLSLKNSSDPSSLAFVEALLQFYLLHIVSSSASGSNVRGSGMVPTFLPLLEDADPNHMHLVYLAVKALQKLMDYNSSAVSLLRELGGAELLSQRLKIEVHRVIGLAGENENSMVISECSRYNDDHTYSQKRLIKFLLKALGSATQTSSNNTRSQNSHDSSLPSTLSLIYGNANKFGGDIYYSAVTVMSEIIHKDPTYFPTLHEMGLPDAFLSSIVAGLLPSSKALTCVPNGLGAICLNAKGLEAVKETSALRFLVDIFTSKKYVMAMNEAIVPLANAIEELLRHVSSLRGTGVDIIIEIVDRIASFGDNNSAGPSGNVAEMEMDSGVKENDGHCCLDGGVDLGAEGISNEQFVQLCIFHLMVLLHRTMENSETCRLFVEKSGIEALLKLLLQPNIVQSPEGMSIALHSTMVFKGFTQHHSAPLARAFCFSLRDHLKKALAGFGANSGSFLLDPRTTPDTEIFPSLFLVEFLLFLAASKDNRWVTALLTEFGNGSKDVLEDIGRVHREVLWHIAMLEDAHLEIEEGGTGSGSELQQTELNIDETEEQRFNSFRQFLNPLLRRRTSGWRVESQVFDLINLYRDLGRATGFPQRLSTDGLSSRFGSIHQSCHSETSDAAGAMSKKDYDKQRSYYTSCCDMVRSLSFHIMHLSQELGKAMLLPSRRRDDTVNVSPSSKVVSGIFASISLDHMNFGGHACPPGSEVSITTKCRYFRKVIDFIDGILLDRPDSCNPILLNCLYGHGVVQSVLTTFEATGQLLFAVNRATASPMETDDGNVKQDEDHSWIYGPLASYGKLMDHLVTSSSILSPFTKHLLAQPLANRASPFPRDAETFVKVLQSMVLKAVLPIWTHPQLTNCSNDFIVTVISIIRHVYSGVEVKNVNNNVSARITGPPPNEATISTIVEMGFSRMRAEEALRQVGSNSVELAMEWLFSHPEETPEDDELARALAMSLGNSESDIKEEDANANGQQVEEEIVQLPPVDELLSTCIKLLQVKEPLAFSVCDLLLLICTQSNGQYRSSVISFILDQVKGQSLNSDARNSTTLSALLHVFALILHEDGPAREIALKDGLVKIVSDLLYQWDSGSVDKEKHQVPKWVTAAFLAVDRILQVDQKLNSEIVEQLKRDELNSQQTSINIDEDKENRLQSALRSPTEKIEAEEQKRLIQIACHCIKNQLPSETMHAVLQLCSTLTRNHSIAVCFLEAEGVSSLLNLPTSSLFTGFDNIAATIVRHVLEDPQTLQQAMESEIKHSLVAAANRHSNGRVTPRNFLLILSSVISRDPLIFMRAAQSVCQVEMVGERPYIVLLKDREKDKSKEKEKEKDKMLEKDKSHTNDGKATWGNMHTLATGYVQGKLHDSNSKSAKVHRKFPQSFITVIELLLGVVSSFVPPSKDEAVVDVPQDVSSSTNMDVDVAAIKGKGKGKAIATVCEEKESSSQEASASLAKVVFILKLLTEIVLMYSSSVHVLLRRDTEISSLRGQKGSTCLWSGGIFHHILGKYIPYSRNVKKDKKLDGDWRHKLATRASQLLVASCVRSTEARKRVFTEISYILNDFVDSCNGSRPPTNDIHTNIDLLNDVLAARTPTGSYISPEASATFVDVGLVKSLTRTLEVLDLDHTDSPKVVTAVIKALELVTKEHVNIDIGKNENSTKPPVQSTLGRAENIVDITQSAEIVPESNHDSVSADHAESFNGVQNFGPSEALADDMEHDQDPNGGYAPANEDDYMQETSQDMRGLENGMDTVGIRFEIQPHGQETLDEDEDEEMSGDDGDEVDGEDDDDDNDDDGEEDDEDHNDLEEDEVHHLPHPDIDQDDHDIDDDEFEEELLEEDDEEEEEDEDGVILRLEEGINGINVFDHIEVFGRDHNFSNETLHVMPVEVFGSRRQGRTTSIYSLLGRNGDTAVPSRHPLLAGPSASRSASGRQSAVSGRDASLHSVTEVSENSSREAEQEGPSVEQQVGGEAGSGSIDPAFLDALPEELRAEVLSAQQGQVAQPSNAEQQNTGDIDPEFLAALPPDIRAEVIAQQQAQRLHQSHELEGQPVEMDTVSIIATFPSDLREEVLLTSSDAVLANLTPALVAEANMLRERFAHRYHNRPLFGMYPRSRRGESSRRGEGIGYSLERAGTASRRSINAKVIEADGSPLVETESLQAMIRVLRIVQPLYKGPFQRLLLNLCAHGDTRTALVKILMDMLMLDRRRSAHYLNAAVPSYRLYACQSSVMYSRPQSFDGVPPLVSRRILETLTYLARNHPYVAKILLQFRLPLPTLQQRENSDQSRGKAVMIVEEYEKDSKQHLEGYISIALLLSLLNQPLYSRSIAHLEQLLNLLEVIIDSAECKGSSSDKSGAGTEQPSTPQNSTSDVKTNMEVSIAIAGSSSIAIDSSKSATPGPNNECDTEAVLLNLPQTELRLLCSFLAREGLSDNAYTLVVEVIKKLVAIAPTHCQLFITELADAVQNLTKSAMNELRLFGEEVKALLRTTSSDGAAILRVLQALSSLVSSLVDKEKSQQIIPEEQQSAALPQLCNINGALEPLWLELSTCISKIESYSDSVPDLLLPRTSTSKPSGVTPPLPAGSHNILPYIESFFVMCEKLHPAQPGSSQDYGAVSEVEDVITPTAHQRTSVPVIKVDEKHMAFVKFSEKHRKLLNSFIRQNPGLLEKSFSLMLKVPRFVDFDNKRSHFRSKIKHQHDHHQSPLRISVRRAYILEDSYNQLRMRSTQDLKGRLTVHFQGEEGIDAGGLTREWYQLLSRVIFDKGALLFTTVGNDSTFQPNPNSVYQTEHLSYFKFVGRVVGKALFDGQLLDVHFTRSFYKHILGVKVTYHDIEAIDPDYFKNLKWMLENDISDVLDLTFSIDADEEKLILYERTQVTDHELIPGGRNVKVTEENKHQYVDLVAEHRLTTAIRPQINAFLEGFSELVHRELISIFNDKELELLISGLPDIDLDDMRANTEYSGYIAASPVIQWFWEVVQGFSKEDKARLLQFVTGTSKVPLEGFSALQGISGSQKFQIHKAYGTPDRLPSAHTCFNQLDLPEYPSKQHLEERLLLAIHEASEGFGFG
uniref:HECT-type E3 ubiquitin transferase n=1 Tax=Manihot esculenta TaxID=3983 RepID=A0A251J556_MANES